MFIHKVHNNLAHEAFPSTVNLHWLHITKKLYNISMNLMHLGWNNLKLKYRLGGEWIKTSSREKDLGLCVDENSIWPSSARFQPRMPTASWAVSKELWPAGQGRWFCPSTSFWWDHIWSPVSNSGVSSTKGHGSFGVNPEEDTKLIGGMEYLSYE